MKLKTVDEIMGMIKDMGNALYILREREITLSKTGTQKYSKKAHNLIDNIHTELEKWQKELDVRAKDLTDTVLTVQKLSKEIESINKIHKFDMDNMFNTLNATHEMNKKKEILLTENIVQSQAEIDRLNAIIKANTSMDFCLQIANRNKELLAENKRLKGE